MRVQPYVSTPGIVMLLLVFWAPAVLGQAVHSLDCEPTLPQVCQQAVVAAGASAAPLSSLRTRLRLAPLLPYKLEVRFEKNSAANVSIVTSRRWESGCAVNGETTMVRI